MDIFKEMERVTNIYRAGMGLEPMRPLMRPEHQHLLRKNVQFYHAYGHGWREEKAAADADPFTGEPDECDLSRWARD